MLSVQQQFRSFFFFPFRQVVGTTQRWDIPLLSLMETWFVRIIAEVIVIIRFDGRVSGNTCKEFNR